MLQKKILVDAMDAIAVIDKKINVIESSTVGKLVFASSDYTSLVGEDDESFLNASVAMSKFMESGENSSEHDDILEHAVKDVSKNLKDVLSTVNDYLIPTINAVCDQAVSDCERFLDLAYLTNKIVYVDVPDNARSQEIAGRVDQILSAGRPILHGPAEFRKLQVSFAGTIKELTDLETGSVELTSLVKQYMDTQRDQDANPVELADKLFSGEYGALNYLSEDYYDQFNLALVRIGLAAALRNNPPAGMNLPLAVYRNCLDTIAYLSAKTIDGLVKTLNGLANRKIVILNHTQHEDRTITMHVLKSTAIPLFEEYGVTSDTLIGAVALGLEPDSHTIGNNLERCNRSAVMTLNTLRAKREQFVNDYAKQRLEYHLINELRDTEEDELPRPIQYILKDVRQAFEKVGNMQIETIHDTCRKIVTDCVYCNPVVTTLLDGRAVARSKNGEISSQQANLESVIDMVVSYLADQIYLDC